MSGTHRNGFDLDSVCGVLYRRDKLEDKTYRACLTCPSLSLSTGSQLSRVQFPTSLKCYLCKLKTQQNTKENNRTYSQAQNTRLYLSALHSITPNPPVYYPLSYGVPVRERYGSTLLPAIREQHDQNCTQSH